MLPVKMPHNNPITILKEAKTRIEVTIIIVTSRGRISGKIKTKTEKKLVLAPTINSNLVNKIGITEEVGRTTIAEITIITLALVVTLVKVAVILIVTTISRILMSSSSLIKSHPSSVKNLKEEDVVGAAAIVVVKVKITKTTEEVNSVTKIVMVAETSKDKVVTVLKLGNNTDLKTRTMEVLRPVRVNTTVMTTRILGKLMIKNRMLIN